MRADVLTGPAPWVVDRLGFAAAAELWVRVPTAIAAAVSRAARGREAARPGAATALGEARWPLPYDELALHLRHLAATTVAGGPRNPYRITVVGGHLILPWCYGRTGAISMSDVRPGRSFGRLARELLRRFGPPPRVRQDPPPRPGEENDARDVAEISAALTRLDGPPRALIAGYACTDEHGLLRVCLGEAGLAPDGFLHWRHVDDLPLPPPTIPRPRRMHFP